MATKKETTVNTTETIMKTEEVKAAPAPAAETEEYVTVRIPIDRNDEGDEVVWVNNRRFIIKRGVPVDVPLCVAEQLEHKERMENARYEYEHNISK